MNYKVQLSQRARREIEDAYLYIRRDAPLSAKRWRAKLQKAISSLRSFPERHSILFDANTAGREIRQTIFGVYVVLYSIDGNTVSVLTVRHGARRPIEPDDLAANG